MLGLRFCARAFSSCGKRGPLFIAVRGPLTVAASPFAEHRLQTRRLSSCSSRAQLLRGMWDLPRPVLEPVSPALAGRLSTTAPPGKPSFQILNPDNGLNSLPQSEGASTQEKGQRELSTCHVWKVARIGDCGAERRGRLGERRGSSKGSLDKRMKEILLDNNREAIDSHQRFLSRDTARSHLYLGRHLQ